MAATTTTRTLPFYNDVAAVSLLLLFLTLTFQGIVSMLLLELCHGRICYVLILLLCIITQCPVSFANFAHNFSGLGIWIVLLNFGSYLIGKCHVCIERSLWLILHVIHFLITINNFIIANSSISLLLLGRLLVLFLPCTLGKIRMLFLKLIQCFFCRVSVLLLFIIAQCPVGCSSFLCHFGNLQSRIFFHYFWANITAKHHVTIGRSFGFLLLL
mmetsp:Transcript_17854/g.31418  ORF Transcript_17854/g.31418 Transcript_17854/m.31418 type:complete len:214 (+) Transcript_17854:652-1293(+)